MRARRVDHEPLAGDVDADLVIVGAGYTGLWTALRAVERQPGLRVVLLEAETVGWAASGRNGGFCEASLTHGDENGRSRWPDEIDTLTRLGLENLDDIEATVRRYGMDVDFERTGMLSVAVEPHQVPWIAEPDAEDGHDVFLDESAVRAELASPTYLAGRWDRRTNAILHPAKLALELARVIVEAGVVVHERTPVRRIDDAGSRVEVVTDRGVVRADRAVLATNVFPSLLKRNRLMTVPVYDYVLMTEPLGDDRLAELGWRNRQGVSDLANQFHYYRLSADGRILFGGYDAVYHAGPARAAPSTRSGRPRSSGSRATSSPRSRSSRASGSATAGRGRSTRARASARSTAVRATARWRTRRGSPASASVRRASPGDVMLDLLDGHETERTSLAMVEDRPWPFPPEPVASMGINLTRWSLDRADHRQGRRNVLLKTLDALGLGFDS